jgi:hypothetical protein
MRHGERNPYSAGCIFCEILAGRSVGSFVYRDEVVAAFMTIGAVNDGHVMVVPVQHASCLEELDPEVGAEMLSWPCVSPRHYVDLICAARGSTCCSTMGESPSNRCTIATCT